MAGMMAYLDENGNLTDVPRDPMIKKVFKQEEIQIGVPKFEDRVEVVRKGVVSFFNKPKGFGFINDLDTKERIFFHVNEILEAIEESDTVQFQVQQGPRGLSAAQVTKLK
jgi:cold shock CspA family protein